MRAGCSGFQETESSAADLTTSQNPASGLRLSSSGRPFCERGEQRGTFRLVGSDGSVREVEYTAKGNALPERHVLALRDKSKKLRGRPGLVKIRHGCRTMRFSCSTLTDGLSAGIPEQSAFMGTRVRRSSVSLYRAFIQTKMLLASS